MKKGNLLFVLPNLFTVSSIFCGVYAVIQATEGSGADRFFLAAMAILFGALFDSADGRVARATKTQSEFGVQLDSLADVITFGVAPAVLLYKWALYPFGFGGMMIAFLFATCGALRLARFNVMARHEVSVPKYFTGLPIPLAATCISSLVLLHHHLGGGTLLSYQPMVMIVTLVLSLLMVSRIRYHTFKKVRLRARSIPWVVVSAALLLVAVYYTSFSFIFVVVCLGFICSGLAEELVRLVRRHSPRHLPKEDK